MKIRIGDKVYLQKYEVAYVLRNLETTHGGFLNEIFEHGKKPFVMGGVEDGYRFDCVFEDPRSVEWLMEQDWIVDYDEYLGMEVEELKEIQHRIKAEYSIGVDQFNAEDLKYREAHFEKAYDRFSKLSHKAISFGELIRHRRGEIRFVFPDEYEGETFASNYAKDDVDVKRPNFFARLFGRSAQ